ncbi:alpha/beta hydrolase [Acidaminobacter sp.]|uniref:alpha/beta hydrolase n=1 Tax=Acidaminobacter sp. TaxID=1872102 RepID=UPI00256D5B1A|nr:alpha/beta hydrolase [Acidaminobacter sp.]MDK9712203.1 alpha/beta hydrolase [Acidaminobacter sp.]
MKSLDLTASDGLKLSTVIFEATNRSTNTKALLQIIHGAQEHKGRYYELAEFLKNHGYTVVLSDIRGHGESVSKDIPQGYMDSLEQVIADQKLISDTIKSLYPGKPLYLYGHSLGSLFARCYLQAHDNEIEKLILSGTVDYRSIVKAGVLLTKLFSLISGKHGHSRLLDHLLGINGKDDSWVSVNVTNREKRRSDPHFFTSYENAGSLTIATSNLYQRAFDRFKCQNPDLEILVISGEHDPITGGPRGLEGSMKALIKAGYKNIESKVYKGLRHEVIHEDDKEIVFSDLLKYLGQ